MYVFIFKYAIIISKDKWHNNEKRLYRSAYYNNDLLFKL
jgi:hypothetical protein